jgi:hypothetical protein
MGGFLDVELWVLMTFAVNTNAQRRITVLPRILEIIELLDLKNWEDLMANVSKFTWLDCVVETESHILKGEIQREQEKQGQWTVEERESERNDQTEIPEGRIEGDPQIWPFTLCYNRLVIV